MRRMRHVNRRKRSICYCAVARTIDRGKIATSGAAGYDPPMKRLPVFRTVNVALRATSRLLGKLAIVLVIPFLLYQLASAFVFREFYAYAVDYISNPDSYYPFMRFSEFVTWIADLGSAVELVVLRLILLPATAYSFLTFLAPGGRGQTPSFRQTLGVVRRLFVIELLYSLLVYIPAIPVFSELTNFSLFLFGRVDLHLLYFPVALIVALRLSSAYPEIVLGRRWSIADQWHRSRGNVVRMLAIAALLIALAVGSVMSMNLLGVSGRWGLMSLSAPSVFDSTRVFIVVAFFETVKAAAICSAYAHLTGHPAFGLPGSAPHLNELSEVFE